MRITVVNRRKLAVLAFCSVLFSGGGIAAPVYSIDNQPLKGQMVAQSQADLCTVAQGTLAYLNKGNSYDPQVIVPGLVSRFGVDMARIKQTLSYVCQVQAEDTKAGRASRLADPAFIRKNFEMIRWMPDKQQSAQFAAKKPLLQNIPDDKILLTKYYIKLAKGSAVKTAKTPHALYGIPVDEQDLTLEQADAKKDSLIRYRYTKQQVLTGILDKNHWAKPLIWLSRDALEDTLMQGTVKIDADDGSSRFFNVHRNNGIGYQRGLKKRQQKRYWYFKQTPGVLGYGKDANYKIPIHPMVTVAGDLQHLGLGKLVMLTHNGQSRLAVLADTGGAFENNQYQLDYLGGFFSNWKDYINTYRTFPDYFAARILVVRNSTNNEE
ncbi:MAG: hypothetical protein ACI8WB_001148 [Phenylobacterium sp.]|jgi:hypothetical protein